MSNTFLVSDTHFGHVGVTRFLTDDGTKMRPWDTVEAMDEAMVERWNSVVRPQDTVYHLGDVVINRKALPTLGRLNGQKILVKGNHDVFRLEEYTPFFKDIRGVGVLDGFVLTHVPIHPGSIERWTGNFHGHTHDKRVMLERYWHEEQEVDGRYLCLCVEQTNFTPISLEDAKARFEAQQ
jgi:calcineurin-like phosphoesterase family protein